MKLLVLGAGFAGVAAAFAARRAGASVTLVHAAAGASGLYRIPLEGDAPELIVSGAALVGVAFGASGQVAVCSNETAFRFD